MTDAGSGNADGGSARVRYRTDDMESDHDQHARVGFLPNPYKIVRYGMISQDDAEKVWSDTLEAWGVSESNATERETLYNFVTAALLQSSSKDSENLDTQWVMRGRLMKLRTIYDNMDIYAQSNNDSRIRTFTRSFRTGFFVVRQYQVLSDPANKEYRNMLAMRTGEDPTNARFMFDTADFLVHAGVDLNTDEMRLINSYRANRTARAQHAANQVGDLTARNDTTSRNSEYGRGKAIAQNGRPAPQSADHRAAMMGLSSLK